MPERELHTLVEGGAYFEGPRWHDSRWWVSDFYRNLIVVATPDGREETIDTGFQPSGIGWLPDGSMLVVSMKDHRLMRRAGDRFEVFADVSEHCAGPLNDMVVDDRGRTYAGNFGFDLMSGGSPAPASLVRVDPDGSSCVVAEDLMFPNGSVVTPDGATLIVGETLGGRYTAFTIAADGSLSDRRTWGDRSGGGAGGEGDAAGGVSQRVAPDGCCLDAEGHIWAADATAGRCARVAPGGAVVDEVKAPDGLGVFACMLGGDDGRTLLLCAAPDFMEENRTKAREAVLFTTTVDVPHAGLP